jgi:ureidoacrylate peracid hydrolase
MHDEPEFFRSGGVVMEACVCWQGRICPKDAMMDSTAEHDTAGYLEVAGRLAHLDLLKTMSEKVSPRHCALLVIDMQNDFIADGGLIAKDGRDTSEAKKLALRLPKLLAAARKAGVLVIFIRNVYSTEQNLYLSDSWLEQAVRKRKGGYTTIPVCGPDSWGGDFYGEVRPLKTEAIVAKHRYSGFHNTNLDTILRANGIRTVVTTGVVSNVCVETTAREAFVRDYYVVLPRDAAAAYSAIDHEQTLTNIDRFFGELSSIDELCTIWRRSNCGHASVNS